MRGAKYFRQTRGTGILATFGKQERQNMKTHPLSAATALQPEEKPANSPVRYQLPAQPKIPIGIALGLVAFIAAVVVAYCLFGR